MATFYTYLTDPPSTYDDHHSISLPVWGYESDVRSHAEQQAHQCPGRRVVLYRLVPVSSCVVPTGAVEWKPEGEFQMVGSLK